MLHVCVSFFSTITGGVNPSPFIFYTFAELDDAPFAQLFKPTDNFVSCCYDVFICYNVL
jgi:hypothetical protein